MADGSGRHHPEFAEASEIEEWARSCASHPERIVSVSILCDPVAPARAICLLDVVQDYAATLANELHGQTFGFSSVIVTVAVTRDFRCAVRPDGLQTQCTCRPRGA